MIGIYYVYGLWNIKLNQPFYIGIAKVTKNCKEGYRPNFHLKEAKKYADSGISTKGANLHKLHLIMKMCNEGNPPNTRILNRGLDKETALELERSLIAEYGRRDLGSGILVNLTNGGEGCSGMSEAGKEKLRQLRKTTPSPIKGRKLVYSEERIAAAAEATRKACNGRTPWNKGKECSSPSLEVREKISRSLMGRPNPMKGRKPWNKGLKKDLP